MTSLKQFLEKPDPDLVLELELTGDLAKDLPDHIDAYLDEENLFIVLPRL